MFYKKLEKLSSSEFKRLTGVKKQTFKLMVKILNVQYAVDYEFGGKSSKLTIEDKLLMTLRYWREYRTYFHIGNSYGYSESQVYKTIKWVETTLINSGVFNIPGEKKLHTLDKDAVVLIDVTESPIERPKKKQRNYYSGKKKKTYNENTNSCK